MNDNNSTREEIIALFDHYDFKDPLGHRLTLCLEFQQLLDRIFGDN